MADQSKTERATPKKRSDERRKGNVFLSKDAVSVATLFAGIVMLRVLFPKMVETIGAFFRTIISLTRTDTGGTVQNGLFLQCVMLVAKLVLPILLVTLAAAVAATFAQTRMLVTAYPLRPKFSRINPLQGFKRLFSLKSLIEALKNMLKIIILLVLIYGSVKDMMDISARFLHANLTGSCKYLLEQLFSMFLKVGLAFVVVAAADYFYQRWDYERQMKMTKEEVKEEYKQTEGDPKVKSKIKEIQRKMAMQRMMQQVPQSDVIIRNPTHVAVALRYHAGEDDAPVVLAMGVDELALRIVKVGEENDVPIVENVPVARALYASCELNRPIPPDLYEAVAEVLVYLYKLGKLKA